MIAPPSRSPPGSRPPLASSPLSPVSPSWTSRSRGATRPVGSCVWLLAASVLFSRSLRVVPCVGTSFLFTAARHPLCGPHTPSVLPAGGRLDGVDFLAVASSTAANSHAQLLTDGRFQLSGAFASSWNCRVVRSSVRSFKDPPDGLPKRPPPCRFPPAAHEGTDAPASPTAGAIPDPGSGQRRGWEAASLCGFDIHFSGEDQLRTF